MFDRKLRTHVLFENSAGGLPHGCSAIRLLRPLSHPSIQANITLTNSMRLPKQPLDVLIIERLWDQMCNWDRHQGMLQTIREQGTKIIYEIDDDLLNVNTEVGDRSLPSTSQKMWLRQMVRFADGVIVSTPNLADRLETLNANIEIVENALDESLFEKSCKINHKPINKPIVFGYMGTLTHLEDLMSIIQPLRSVLARYRDRVRFEVVGVGEHAMLQKLFAGLPVRFLSVPLESQMYEKFTVWLQENIRWDFGIAPLVDSTFTRSKSDIKFLDYGVQGIPGIFSAVPAYNGTVKHLENGILATDIQSWEKWLEKLILDDQLRVGLANAAHDYVWRERMLERTAIKWQDAINKLARIPRSVNRQMRRVLKPPHTMTRNEKMLYGANLLGMGLEIGASYCPVAAKRAGYRVEVLDHADAATLREKYQGHNVDISNIEEVDYIWTGEPLHELTRKADYYDWIVASHVIEHTPDFVSFMRQCEIMLKPGGLLCLAVPDRRYCFDVFRPVSTPGDIIQAFLEKRSRHCFGVIWDHFSMITKKGDLVAWHKNHDGEYQFIHPDLGEARAMLARSQELKEYIDVHNWRFTPSSFKLVMNDIGMLGYTSLSISTFFETEGCEFIAQLKKGSASSFANNEREGLIRDMLKESLELAG